MTPELRAFFNACNPLEPPRPEDYVSADDARGDKHFSDRVCHRLTQDAKDRQFLFTGHVGCGKSSELEFLRRRLLKEKCGASRVLPVFVDADEYFSGRDIEPMDVHIAILAELAQTMRGGDPGALDEGNDVKIDLTQAKTFGPVVRLLDKVREQFEFSKLEIAVGGVKAEIQRNLKSDGFRYRLRETLNRPEKSLLEETNLILDEAGEMLRANNRARGGRGFDRIALIVDNMEKLYETGDVAENEKRLAHLYVAQSDKFIGLATSLILTVPLYFARSSGTDLQSRYLEPPFVLPMIKVWNRERTDRYAVGVGRLQEILARRLDGVALGDAFEKPALDWLVNYCGGHPRHLLLFVREACLECDAFPITEEAAQRALVPTIRNWSADMRRRWWPKLAYIENNPSEAIEPDDIEASALLRRNYILEYLNGLADGATNNAFAPPRQWYGVHPIIREFQEFKDADARYKRDLAKSAVE